MIHYIEHRTWVLGARILSSSIPDGVQILQVPEVGAMTFAAAPLPTLNFERFGRLTATASPGALETIAPRVAAGGWTLTHLEISVTDLGLLTSIAVFTIPEGWDLTGWEDVSNTISDRLDAEFPLFRAVVRHLEGSSLVAVDERYRFGVPPSLEGLDQHDEENTLVFHAHLVFDAARAREREALVGSLRLEEPPIRVAGMDAWPGWAVCLWQHPSHATRDAMCDAVLVQAPFAARAAIFHAGSSACTALLDLALRPGARVSTRSVRPVLHLNDLWLQRIRQRDKQMNEDQWAFHIRQRAASQLDEEEQAFHGTRAALAARVESLGAEEQAASARAVEALLFALACLGLYSVTNDVLSVLSMPLDSTMDAAPANRGLVLIITGTVAALLLWAWSRARRRD